MPPVSRKKIVEECATLLAREAQKFSDDPTWFSALRYASFILRKEFKLPIPALGVIWESEALAVNKTTGPSKSSTASKQSPKSRSKRKGKASQSKSNKESETG